MKFHCKRHRTSFQNSILTLFLHVSVCNSPSSMCFGCISKVGRADVGCRSVTAALCRSESYRRNTEAWQHWLILM